MNLSINTIKTQKQRALKTIMKKLNPEFLPVLLLWYSMIR
ncbi:hypothetical protein OKW96_08105 [Sphingobacterium sp. KU25419]|nr:hypothetical protein OKW96_08105 [Sphingobacterium sp. KU25419]